MIFFKLLAILLAVNPHAPQANCVDSGDSCVDTSDCCAGVCIPLITNSPDWICCKDKWDLCNNNEECCSKRCVNGRCCHGTGGRCYFDGGCCSGSCIIDHTSSTKGGKCALTLNSAGCAYSDDCRAESLCIGGQCIGPPTSTPTEAPTTPPTSSTQAPTTITTSPTNPTTSPTPFPTPPTTIPTTTPTTPPTTCVLPGQPCLHGTCCWGGACENGECACRKGGEACLPFTCCLSGACTQGTCWCKEEGVKCTDDTWCCSHKCENIDPSTGLGECARPSTTAPPTAAPTAYPTLSCVPPGQPCLPFTCCLSGACTQGTCWCREGGGECADDNWCCSHKCENIDPSTGTGQCSAPSTYPAIAPTPEPTSRRRR